MNRQMLTAITVLVVLAVLLLTGCPAPEQTAAPTPPAPVDTHPPADDDAGLSGKTPDDAPAVADDEPADDTDYDMGEVPEHSPEHIISAVVPPEGSVPETDQWPAALWSAVGDGKLVIYAKHQTGYDSSSEQGNFLVWCGPPWQYVEACREDGGYDADDAAAYLKSLGIRSVEAEMYIGPGDKSGPAPGYSAWTSGSDRCVAMLFQPKRYKKLNKRVTIWANMEDGEKVFIYRGPCRCDCPKYPDGEVDGDWIRVSVRGNEFQKVDQWGLPGNTPVPDEDNDGPS